MAEIRSPLTHLVTNGLLFFALCFNVRNVISLRIQSTIPSHLLSFKTTLPKSALNHHIFSTCDTELIFFQKRGTSFFPIFIGCFLRTFVMIHGISFSVIRSSMQTFFFRLSAFLLLLEIDHFLVLKS